MKNFNNLSMIEKMYEFMDFFTTISKEQSDFIEDVLNWSYETKVAFLHAKRIFEKENERVCTDTGRTEQ